MNVRILWIKGSNPSFSVAEIMLAFHIGVTQFAGAILILGVGIYDIFVSDKRKRMRYTLFDFISENERVFLKVRFGLVALMIFLTVVIGIMLENNNKSANDFPNESIEVFEVKKGVFYKKPDATFNFKKEIEIESLIISNGDNLFFVNKNLKVFWDEIIDEVHKGDQLILHYQIIDNRKELVHLETSSRVIFSWNDMWKKHTTGDLVIIGLWFISLFSLYIISRKRKKIKTKTGSIN